MAIPWNEITPQLLSRYGKPAPRYTSYPTAPEWTDKFGKEDYLRALEKADTTPEAPLSMYVHIPYCKVRCLYCGCASWVSTSPDDYDIYLDALEAELRSVTLPLANRRLVSQLHFGGGTPTTLDPPRLERLFKLITNHFTLTDQAEVAVEVSPAVTTFEQIDTMAGLGFNRISLGVQDFTPEVQEAVSRIQSVELTQGLTDKARAAGFNGVNMDLMYGLPRQRLDTWSKTLKTVIEIDPDRLAVFGYAHVPWMRPHQEGINEEELPNTGTRFDLFRMAHDTLTNAGYVYIGMDHFAKPDDELARALEERRLWRNFQGYTVQQAGELIGLGVTAISDVAGSFAQNRSQLDEYLSGATAGELLTYRGVATSDDDKVRRYVITNLMCNLHLSLSEVDERFGINFWSYFSHEQNQLKGLAEDGLVEVDDKVITVPAKGRIFVRHVGMVFDTYTRSRAKDAGPRFSRTV